MGKAFAAVLVLVLLSPAAAAPVAPVLMDAAEQYLDGSLLSLDGSFAAVRLRVDNREGLSDLLDVQWAMSYTGHLFSVTAWQPEDGANPWRGVPLPGAVQIVGDLQYGAGIIYSTQLGIWGPCWQRRTVGIEDPHDDPAYAELAWVIPAGVLWDRCYKLSGQGVHLFASPATGELAIGGEVFGYSDDDPTPQSVPEPATLAVLGFGLVLAARRRHDRA